MGLRRDRRRSGLGRCGVASNGAAAGTGLLGLWWLPNPVGLAARKRVGGRQRLAGWA
jgi:hypothetical protein